MGLAWLTTLPLAALVGAAMWWIGHLIGGTAGVVTVFAIMCVAALYMRWHSRRNPVGHHNVNDEWAGDAKSEPKVPVPGGVH
jgi:PiT family inorganic phosphate transporter